MGARDIIDQYRQWEDHYLNAQLSCCAVRLSTDRPMGGVELTAVVQIIRNHPGNQSVSFQFGKVKLTDVMTMQLTDQAQKSLEAYGFVVEEVL
jgi:hypothetical protein